MRGVLFVLCVMMLYARMYVVVVTQIFGAVIFLEELITRMHYYLLFTTSAN